MFYKKATIGLAAVLVSAWWAAIPPAGLAQTVPPATVPDERGADDRSAARDVAGKKCLFIGHSFFIPVAKVFKNHAAKAGVDDHSQQAVFAGGQGGSPGRLWQNQKKRKEIQKILDGGDVELLGMTYFNSSLGDYRKWIDYALEKNPKTEFFIGMPWGKDGPSRSVESFASVSSRAQSEFYPEVVKKLRELYPKNRFYWINYGRVAVELKRAYEDGALPLVKQPVSRNGSDSIFRDQMGHAAPLTLEMASLVWLSVLYDVEPADCQWRHQGAAKLEAILKKIVEQEKTYNPAGPAEN
jgi:hypothetical protein